MVPCTRASLVAQQENAGSQDLREMRIAAQYQQAGEGMSEPIDFGWLNNGLKEDDAAIVAKCEAAHPPHKRTDIDIGPRHRGMNHVVTCETCGYVYHYDSSD